MKIYKITDYSETFVDEVITSEIYFIKTALTCSESNLLVNCKFFYYTYNGFVYKLTNISVDGFKLLQDIVTYKIDTETPDITAFEFFEGNVKTVRLLPNSNYQVKFEKSKAVLSLNKDYILPYFTGYCKSVLGLSSSIDLVTFNTIHDDELEIVSFEIKENYTLELGYKRKNYIRAVELSFIDKAKLYSWLEYVLPSGCYTTIFRYGIIKASLANLEAISSEIKYFTRQGNSVKLNYYNGTFSRIGFKDLIQLEYYIEHNIAKVRIFGAYNLEFDKFTQNELNYIPSLDSWQINVNVIDYKLKGDETMRVEYVDLDLLDKQIKSLDNVYKKPTIDISIFTPENMIKAKFMDYDDGFTQLVDEIVSTAEGNAEFLKAKEWVKLTFYSGKDYSDNEIEIKGTYPHWIEKFAKNPLNSSSLIKGLVKKYTIYPLAKTIEFDIGTSSIKVYYRKNYFKIANQLKSMGITTNDTLYIEPITMSGKMLDEHIISLRKYIEISNSLTNNCGFISFKLTELGGVLTFKDGISLEFIEEDHAKRIKTNVRILCELLETSYQYQGTDGIFQVYDVLSNMYNNTLPEYEWEIDGNVIVFKDFKLIPTYGESSLGKLVDKLDIKKYKGINILSYSTVGYSNDFTLKPTVLLKHLTGNAKSIVKFIAENKLSIEILNKGTGDSKEYFVQYNNTELCDKVFNNNTLFKIIQSDTQGISFKTTLPYSYLSKCFSGLLKSVSVKKIKDNTVDFVIYNSKAGVTEKHTVYYIDNNTMKQVIEFNYPMTDFANLAKAYKAGVIDFSEFENKVAKLITIKKKSYKTITLPSDISMLTQLLQYYEIYLGEAICSDGKNITYVFDYTNVESDVHMN